MNDTHITQSVEETTTCAYTFAGKLQRGDIVALYGDLGTGKTQFVKGVCRAFSAHTPVTSPSFVILNRYEGVDKQGQELLLYHLDLYRVKSFTEIYDLGYEEFFQNNSICFIEWAEILGVLLPRRRYDIRLSFGDEECERRIKIVSLGGYIS